MPTDFYVLAGVRRHWWVLLIYLLAIAGLSGSLYWKDASSALQLLWGFGAGGLLILLGLLGWTERLIVRSREGLGPRFTVIQGGKRQELRLPERKRKAD